MKKLKVILILLTLIFIEIINASNDFKLINAPTGLILGNAQSFSQLTFEDNGNIRIEANVGILNFFEIGVSLLTENVIGNSNIIVNVPAPYLGFQILSPKMNFPFYTKLGWDGKDIIPMFTHLNPSRRGMFLSMTKLFKNNKKLFGTMTLGTHIPFINDNYMGFYFLSNFYFTKFITIYFNLDDFGGVFLSGSQSGFDFKDFFRFGSAIEANMNNNWGIGFQFLLDGNGNFYRYFFVRYMRWL
ncbi:hypothetical protein J7L48_11260 [bacterium]|nr:hypothetical protein [bacterium]